MSISKCFLVCKLLAAASLALAAHTASAALIFLQPPAGSIEVGDSFSLQLLGNDFDSSLDGGGIDLAFDPAVLRLASVTVDAGTWEFFASDGVIDNTQGAASDVLFASFEERLGGFSIASFTFEALTAGNSLLTLSESLLNPFASGGALLPVEFGILSIWVVDAQPPTSVPLPGALGLMLIGLASLALTRLGKCARVTH